MDVFAISLKLKEEGAATVKAAVDKLLKSFTQTSAAGAKLDSTNSKLAGSFKQLAASMAATYGVGQLANMADSYTNLNARLSLVVKNSDELASVQRQLFEIAQASRTPFEEIVGLYLRTANASTALGLEQADVIKLTEQTARAVALSGSSAAEAAAAIQQLGQAFNNGMVQAQEWNSIAEQTPRLARAIAESVGMTTAEFRKAVLEQRVSSDVLAQAILQNKNLAAEAAKLPTTIGGAFTQLRNQVLLLVGEINKGTGASENVVKMLTWIGENMPIIAGVIASVTLVWGGYRLALIGVAAAQTAVAAATAIASGNIVQAGAVAAGATIAVAAFSEVYSRLNNMLKTTAGGGAGAAGGSPAASPFKPLELGLKNTTEKGKTTIEMLTELASIAPISKQQAATLTAEHERLTATLAKGNLTLEKRLKLTKEQVAIGDALRDAEIQLSAQELTDLQRMMGRGTAAPMMAAAGPAPVVAVDPAIVSQVKAQMDATEKEFKARADELRQNVGADLAQGLTMTLADSIGSAFETAFATGNIGEGFKALGRAMLSGLGSMIQAFGVKALAASKLMATLLESFKTLKPYIAIPAALGLIALGGALKGAAAGAFGGAMGAGMGGTPFVSTIGGQVGGAGRLPGVFYGPTAAGGVGQIQPTPSMNVTIIGPNDPSAQRQMQELMRNAQRRGNV